MENGRTRPSRRLFAADVEELDDRSLGGRRDGIGVRAPPRGSPKGDAANPQWCTTCRCQPKNARDGRTLGPPSGHVGAASQATKRGTSECGPIQFTAGRIGGVAGTGIGSNPATAMPPRWRSRETRSSAASALRISRRRRGSGIAASMATSERCQNHAHAIGGSTFRGLR